ncbi:hypothetical protein DVW83_11205 [Enterococcus sp. VV15]|nr:hypothetical protein DVW83_11205 [Enterococcus sp. VV15]
MWLKTLYRKRAVTWPFIFYTIIWTLSTRMLKNLFFHFLPKKQHFFQIQKKNVVFFVYYYFCDIKNKRRRG